jgi:hypothetical protein
MRGHQNAKVRTAAKSIIRGSGGGGRNELAKYFVETDQWNRIFRGEIDIIQGDKGAGKSAIYSLLVAKTNELFDKNILLITAEQPRGATVFRDLVSDPPTSENEFISLWKLYI